MCGQTACHKPIASQHIIGSVDLMCADTDIGALSPYDHSGQLCDGQILKT
jgi:hypothetical protein